MSALCRYEILLPLQFNDGRPVPDALLSQKLRELREQFGTAPWETQRIRGQWEHRGSLYSKELTRVFVDVEDSPTNRGFFRAYKERLKVRFNQIDVWLTVHPITAL